MMIDKLGIGARRPLSGVLSLVFSAPTVTMRGITRAASLFMLSLFSPLAFGQAGNFVTFESGQVRPLALSADGSRLYAVNTPDHRVEVFQVAAGGIAHIDSVVVGMEPVAVAVHPNGQIWVVNHLSDSISIVAPGDQDVAPRVVRTLLVGDEPRDIVFAGPGMSKAFITTAHRGQNSPVSFSPLETTGRADVWVYDVDALGEQPQVVTMFGDTPRALAVSPNGQRVYAAVFHSGNRTTILSRNTVLGDLPAPVDNVEGVPVPFDVGLIVKANDQGWADASGRDWTQAVRTQLPDWDVFVLDATQDKVDTIGLYSGVGTTLFNMTVNPTNGHVYVSNTDARNDVRYEGPGIYGPSTVRGHFIENRITVIDGPTVTPRHLNPHFNYDVFPGTAEERDASLATPTQMAIQSDGSTLYLAAFGSARIAVLNVEQLEQGIYTPDPTRLIEVSGGGPSGVILDEALNRLYVLTRFDNGVSVINLNTRQEAQHLLMHNPEPDSVVQGRPFLYDARLSSSRGDSSCAGCHIFGDTDHLAWDLGNPDGSVVRNDNPLALPLPSGDDTFFHPVKGPMSTQSLRGLAGQGPMHWRGDRTGAQADGTGALNEELAFMAFNGAYESLLGRTTPLSESEMLTFAAYALQISYPPNPVRALDNSLSVSQARGFDIYQTRETDGIQTCIACHELDPVNGRFGTGGLSVIRRFQGGDFRQALKIPHLRNLYTKVGFFGGSREEPGQPNLGDQIRGFGFGHDAAEDTLLSFFQDFQNIDDTDRRDIVDFLLAYDSNLAPIVGQQVTLAPGNLPLASARLQLLLNRAAVLTPRPECDLITRGNFNGLSRGMVRLSSGAFRSDFSPDPLFSVGQLMQLSQVPGNEITFTCVPPGSGVRMAIDRDSDGFLDGDETQAGSDPADPGSVPAGSDKPDPKALAHR